MEGKEGTVPEAERADEKLSSASRAGLRRPHSSANSADEESSYNIKCILTLIVVVNILYFALIVQKNQLRDAGTQNVNLHKYISKGKASDLATLYQKQENLLKLIRKEFRLDTDSPRAQAELS